jgi:CRISPR-associated protein Cas2
MPMTVVVTRDVASRVRGFLTSCFLEIAPGVYVSPDLSAGVRDRAWAVLEDWMSEPGMGSAVMTWPDSSAAGGQQVRFIGEPPKDLWAVGDLILLRRDVADAPAAYAEGRSLKSE